MHQKFHAIALGSAALLTAIAHAGTVPSSRFILGSTILLDSETMGEANADSNSVGSLYADLDSGAGTGSVESFMTATEESLSISSIMAVSDIFRGSSFGSGRYDFASTISLVIDWNWQHTDDAGGWRVLGADGSVAASFTFAAGTFTSEGGSFGTSAVGATVLNLAEGSYTLEAYYFGDTMPTGSVVNFNFGAIPAPGALALLGAAGLVGTKRRRA
jgi:hypothetical protein